MITYQWKISSLETAPSLDSLTDVVRVIHWRYQATDGDYQSETYSSYACGEPSPNDFTAYPDLTEADVIGWLESGLDVQAMEESLANQIADLKNPKIVSLPLPWSENNAE